MTAADVAGWPTARAELALEQLRELGQVDSEHRFECRLGRLRRRGVA